MLIRSTYQANDSNTNNAPEIKFMEPGRKLIVLTAILNLGTMISPALQIHLKKICAVLVIISLRKTLQAEASSIDDLLSTSLLFYIIYRSFYKSTMRKCSCTVTEKFHLHYMQGRD